jgi:hypothetical protein
LQHGRWKQPWCAKIDSDGDEKTETTGLRNFNQHFPQLHFKRFPLIAGMRREMENLSGRSKKRRIAGKGGRRRMNSKGGKREALNRESLTAKIKL